MTLNVTKFAAIKGKQSGDDYFTVICEMGLIEKFSILVTSSYDNQQYKVQEHPNSEEAANLLAKINQNIDILIKHLKDNYPDHEGVRRLIRRLKFAYIKI